MNKKTRFVISIVLNIIMVITAAVGVAVMFFGNHESATGLTSTGFENFKFYTVLTNVAAGIAALYTLAYLVDKKTDLIPKHIIIIKLLSVAGVGLTFFIVALFLGPIPMTGTDF